MLFNNRRGGKTEQVTLEAYEKRRNKSDNLKELKILQVEKMLCSTFDRIEIQGKKGPIVTVPVLLTPSIQSSIDMLIQERKRNRCQLR